MEGNGVNELTVVIIQFRTTDDAGGVFNPTGIILKVTWVQTFGEMQEGIFQTFVVNDGSIFAEIFSAGQNPIDDAGAVVPVDLEFGGQRINVE